MLVGLVKKNGIVMIDLARKPESVSCDTFRRQKGPHPCGVWA
jgi:hypothetical protein